MRCSFSVKYSRLINAVVAFLFNICAVVGFDLDYDNNCRVNIVGRNSSGGVIRSPAYPRNYSQEVSCVYSFTSVGRQRVQIIFRDFNLYLPSDARHFDKCKEENDHVKVTIAIGSSQAGIPLFCGDKRPPRLMSAANSLTVKFVSKSTQRGGYGQLEAVKSHLFDRLISSKRRRPYRFEFEYRFVDNFGIDLEKESIETDRNKECNFIFRSEMREKGTLRSPNYPGYYPRSTDCEYEFHGSNGELVKIHFTYFDVEGTSGQCRRLNGDYVLFSNYQHPDRTNQHYCGLNTPTKEPVISESNYFRMLFHTNKIFDGTGFFAHYQFVNMTNKLNLKRVKPKLPSGSGVVVETTGRRRFGQLFCLIAALIFARLQ